ncbi:glycosyltransferase family 9 protein [Spongiimicrobium salis]|uniref:glycosyltransferase family 9 protein n=1 Tax=Spongiimicrobium salis TaxID=1667022 RepID=UPI00374D2DE8
MGDVAMTVPVILALRQQYPHLRITVLTRAFFAPMFSQLPNVNVFSAETKGKHKGVLGLWKLYRALQRQNIDAVADFHNVLRSNILKVYFKWSSIPFVQIDKGRAEKKRLTASSNKIFEPLKTTHQRYADVLGKLGFQIVLSQAQTLPRQPIAADTQQLIKADTKRWIGIAPFAAFKGKMYPLDHMQEVIGLITKTNRYKVVLFGGKGDAQILSGWANQFKSCINMAGKVAFKEELALISQLDLMLSMDSGNAHIAAMFGIPVVTLWGITHPYAGFYPFGQDADNALLADREKFPQIPTSIYGNKMPDGYEHAMETILPEAVFNKIIEVLNKS